ncbi:copper resistance CopC/CopD family protein [Streptantibioticus silvisoli]|uniref:Copper resistance protein CopC n=1 Tax=Streptantibioticus silvisoli TaxID=2705255 RepID=A0ABT6W2N7_9ACTN|nr:copper resistance protein CopC [Streptantibioticus silvisoli]MDI5964247.1 copper resistance protein CopC [Streptantibioticus silvisoli]
MGLRRLIVVLGVLTAVLFGGALPASAHAALLRSDPSQGSVVRTAPDRITLYFSEGVLLSADSLTVYDPAGKPVQRGAPGHAAGRPDSATIGLRSGLRDGTYTVAWKAVSADTHPVGGAWTFSVGAPSKTSAIPRQTEAGGGLAGALYGIGRYVAYLGFAVLVGSAAFLALCWPGGTRLRPLRRLATGGWAAVAAATIALLLLRGPYVNGTRLGGVFDLAGLRSVVGSPSGEALVCRLLLLAAAAVVLSVLFGGRRAEPEDGPRAEPQGRPRTGALVAGAVVAAGIAATWSLTEHASVGVQPALAMPLDIAHLLSMAVWLGGLTALLTGLYRAGGVPAAAVRRFSGIAFSCVCVLVSTGVYQSWRQVGSWHALFGTAYGRWLLVKIALVACVVAVAGVSRRWTAKLTTAEAGTPAEAVKAEAATEAVNAEALKAEAAAEAVKTEAAAVVGAGPPDGTRPSADRPTDPLRAAQLARQRAVRERVSRLRVRDADPVRSGLRRSVLAEAAIAVVVLAVTTVLSGSEPGRAAEEAKAAASANGMATAPAATGEYLATVPFDSGGPKGKGTVDVHLAPARTGADQLHLVVSDPVGNPMNVPELDVAFTLTARGIGPLPVRLRHTGPGSWEAVGLQVPMPGTWQLSLTVRTSAIDEVTVTRKVTIS